MTTILRPRALRPGDTVAVAALSSGMDDVDGPALDAGVEAIRQMGFNVHISPLVEAGRQWWWSAARPSEIADELNRLLRDPDVRAIFVIAGGRTAMSYLDLIDYEAVRRDPKPLIGFSDIDVLHLALHSQTGLVSVHGDLVLEGFAHRNEASDSDRQGLHEAYLQVLTSSDAPGGLPAIGQWERWRSGRAQGRLVGALLNRLILIQATPYALDADRFDGAILFWEELATSYAAIWNGLHALRYAGVLDRIAGMVVGTAVDVSPTEGGPETLRDVVLDVLGDRDIPVLGNVDIGHNPPNIPLPLGVRAEMDADALTIALLEPAVRVDASA
jgi:muramoyltetrapeptide carboxypeptidase